MSQQCLLCSKDSQPGRARCHQCTESERRLLREIETYFIMLPALLVPAVTTPERRAPGFGSAPPLDLNVAVALDVRSKLWADRIVDGVYEPDPEVDEDEPGRSILVELESLARVRREDFGEEQPSKLATLCSEIAYLLGIAERCSFEPWVDEHAETIRGVHAYARALAKDKPPGPIGECLKVGCGGMVFWCRDVIIRGESFDAGRCASCNEEYCGARLLRVKVKEASKVTMRMIRTLPNGAVLWHMDPNRGFGWTCPCGEHSQTQGGVNEAQYAYDGHFLWTHLWPAFAPVEQREAG